MTTFKKAHGIKVVGQVYGNWTETTSQSVVAGILPSLGKVDAVAGEGGEMYGAYEAFKAAGRPTPLLIMGNRGDAMDLWYSLYKNDHKYNTLSESSSPTVGDAAFWLALNKLDGQKVPKSVTMPTVDVTLHDMLTKDHNLPANYVVGTYYSNKWVEANLLK